MDGEKLRDGIFALRTRRFGSVAECMVKRLLNCSLAQSLFHDLYDEQLHHRIEVKFSVVQKKAERRGPTIFSAPPAPSFRHPGHQTVQQSHAVRPLGTVQVFSAS